MNETFSNFNKTNLSTARKRAFERLIMMLMQNHDESVWSTSIESIHEYYKLAKEDEFIKDMLSSYASDLVDAQEDSLEFEKKVKIFVKITQQSIPKLNAFIETLVFTTELKPWQLEVIANTAKQFGPKMYKNGVLRQGLSFFTDQYLLQTKTPEKGQLMLYTIKQLVESLNEESEGMFVTQVMDYVKKYIHNKEANLVLLSLGLEVLTQFYEFNSLAENEYLPTILDNLIPLLKEDSARSGTVFESLGKFFKVFLSLL